MMIKHIIFARSNVILSDQNACLSNYNIMEEGLVKILLDQDDRAKNFVRSYVFFPNHMILIGLINDHGYTFAQN